MNKIMNKIVTLGLSLCMLAGCSSSTTTSSSTSTTSSVSTPEPVPTEVTLVDHADRTVTVPTNPEKVAFLSILPLPSMLTVYLDSAESIVAMQPASMNAAKSTILSTLYPEILNVDTNIMDGNDVNIEALVAKEPDIVFFNAGNKKELEMLENAGLTAVGVSPTKWGFDCIKTYEEWMNLLDQIYPTHASSEREALIKQYAQDNYDEIQEQVSQLKDKQRILFLYSYDDTAIVTSSSKFFGQWWCEAVGAINVAQDVQAEKSNAVITMEQIYEWNPDVIFITNFTQAQPEDLYENKIGSDDWSSINAVKNQRVYKMPQGVYRTFTPGVDTPITLKWMAQAVYPELFSDVDINAYTKDYYKQLFGIELTDSNLESMITNNK